MQRDMRKDIRALGLCLLVAGLCVERPAAAQSDYYRHVFFDNSQQLEHVLAKRARPRRHRASSSRSD